MDDIPDFLRMTAAQRRAAWRRFKPRPTAEPLRPTMAQLDAQRVAERRERAKARAAERRERAEAEARAKARAAARGWRVLACGQVVVMTKAKLRRLRREMPTARHRDILERRYGPKRREV